MRNVVINLLAGLLLSSTVLAEGKLPQAEARPGYVDEASCLNCHPQQAQAWRSSKHRLAMQPATPDSVLGDFQQPLPGKFAENSRLTAAGGQFHVRTPGADGQSRDTAIPYVLGVRPLQQLLLAQPGGRLQAFTLAWDTVRHRWFDLQAEESIPAKPGESLHWSGRYQNWNLMCGECHTTAFRKGYDEQNDQYATTWASDHVGCQACHGPGQTHVKQQQTGQTAPYGPRHDSFAQVDQCASCHARRTRLVEDAEPQAAFLDNFQPDTLRPDLYYPDGQQLAEVFEYGSFRQSRMYQAGVSCRDCHDSHSGQLNAEGNALCVRCHNPAPDPQYPALQAKNYDSPQHHFHASDKAGSQCVDCHMPSRNYMVVHPRRDHAIRIPRPDLSQRLNTPNACNQCHAERDAAWAQAAIDRHFGPRQRPRHYGEILAAGQHGQDLPALAGLSVDPQQAGIVRATAVELLARVAPQLLPDATLRDADPAVRSVAAMAMANHPPAQRPAALAPLLHDPRRAVRIAAARSLAGLPPNSLPAQHQAAQRQGLADYIAAQQAMADMPAAQINLASLYAELGQAPATLAHFRRAVRQDPAALPSRLNFARWLISQGRPAEAEQLLRDGLPVSANPAVLHQALALLLAEQGNWAAADQELSQALALDPNNPRLRQQQAILRQRLAPRQ